MFPLTEPRGPLSAAVIDHYLGRRGALTAGQFLIDESRLLAAGPGGVIDDDDFQLALTCCYEAHYQGVDVEVDLEWDPQLLAFRRLLEMAFERALRQLVPMHAGTPDARAVLMGLATGGAGGAAAPSLSRWMLEHGSVEAFREFLVHRSAYQLKEADPHSWAIPRLTGRAKAALVEIQHGEYGAGAAEQVHARLFAEALDAAGLSSTYGAYVGRLPGITLATQNLISMFGLQRRFAPAIVGHLALFEMTSVGPMGRYAAAADALGLPAAVRRFYDVHVEADVGHSKLALDELVDGHVTDHPNDAALVVWGAETLTAVEGRFSRHLISHWDRGESSLLAEPAGPAAPTAGFAAAQPPRARRAGSMAARSRGSESRSTPTWASASANATPCSPTSRAAWAATS